MKLDRSLAAAICLLLAVLPQRVGADPVDPWAAWRWASFDRLGEAVGLPHITTTAIVRARDGTMWIGTRGGLTQYDGQRVRVFKQVQADLHSLPDNYVRALLALPDGGILVGTNVGGLARYDPQRGHFVRLKAVGGQIGARIFGFTSDGAGGAYIASDGGVHHYAAGVDGIDPMAESAITSADGRPQGAFAVHRDADGTLWAGCDQGLWVLRPGARRFDSVPLARQRLTGDVWAIMRDRRGRLWVGTGADGVYLSTAGGNRTGFRQIPALSGDSPLIGHRTIRAMIEDRQGRVWIGTDGMGIVLVDPARPSAATAMRRIAANPLSLAGDTVRSLALDGSGGVWAATELGASHARGRDDAVLRIGSAMPDPRLSLSDDNVRGILIDRRHRIWLGLSNGSIDQLDRSAGRVRHLTLKGHHSGQDIKALLDAADGSILVGARGLVAIDPATMAQHDVSIPELGGLPVISLAETRRHLLIGTYKGLYVRDQATGRVTLFQHDPANPRSLPNNEVINIVTLGNGEVMVATPGGIGRFDPDKGAFTNYSNRADDPGSLPQDYAGSIVPVGRTLWVGTYGGVAFGQPTAGGWRFRAISEAHGLSGDNVASLILDSRSRIWAASAGGISVIDPAARYVHTMGRRDGLTIRAFNQRAAARMADGSLLFGSPDGLIVLRPDTLLGRPHQADGAKLIVSEAEVDGRRLPINSALSHPVLRLGRDGRTLRLGFALTDYDAPEEIRYSYRLHGFDREWMAVPAGTPAGATYTNLAAGTYTLELRAQVPGLTARTVTRRIAIEVDPQWHETWPARLAIVALVLLSLGGAFWLVTAVVRRRARMLEAMVQERTSALRVANEQLDRLANTDPLTGLANRRTLMSATEGARERAERFGQGFAFALLDLDHFKRINDHYGHSVGDAVLVAVSARIEGSIRGKDQVARYGGEEIAILFADTALTDATTIIDRLREDMATSPILTAHQSICVTMSAGVAAWREGDTVADLIRRADEALYRAKRGGRNRVERTEDVAMPTRV